MLKGQEVTVLGAGIGGLAAAVALARRGALVRVIEQAPEISEVGAGLQISPNGVRVLDALDLGTVARAASVRSRGVWLRDGPSGRSVVELDLAGQAPDEAFLLFHRADLIGLLDEAARALGVTVELGRRIEVVVPGDRGCRITDTEGETEEVAFLVAADGLHSVLRPHLNGAARPFFTRQVAWRALVRASGREEAEAAIYMGPGRHMVTYPLRDGQLVNVVAVEERDAWADEGWHHTDAPEHLRAAFAGFCDDARAVLERVDETYLWGLFRHPVAQVWHRGRSALLGDAAHPTLPFLAQGAVMALEDAWVLAEALGGLGLDEGPAAYQAKRRARCESIVAAANRNARNYHLSGPLSRRVAHGLLRSYDRLAPGRMLHRFDWLYGHDVTKA